MGRCAPHYIRNLPDRGGIEPVTDRIYYRELGSDVGASAHDTPPRVRRHRAPRDGLSSHGDASYNCRLVPHRHARTNADLDQASAMAVA